MFIKHELEESTWTPELGGKFNNLKLKIKANLEAAQRKKRSEYMETRFHPKTHQSEIFFNKTRFVADFNLALLNLIVDWENMINDNKQPVPFTKENVKFLENYFEFETGQEDKFDIFDTETMSPSGQQETRLAKLGEYINLFSSKVENFEKNL